MTPANIRPLEDGIERDLEGLNYGSYLHLDQLLGAQRPLSDHHDEMLFIVVHHVTELWIKLVIHEIRSAIKLLHSDELGPALKRLARVKHVQRQMIEQWKVFPLFALLCSGAFAPNQFFALPVSLLIGISVAAATGAVRRSLKNRGEIAEYILPAISAARRPASVEPVVITVTTSLGSSALENEVNKPSRPRLPVQVPVLPAT